MSKCIKIAIADDHMMVIQGVQRVLEVCEGFNITGIYKNAGALLAGLRVQENVPDVLLLDVQLPDKMGYEIAEELNRNYPQMSILVLSGVDSNYFIQTMIRQGCRGYLLKGNTDSSLLISAIKSVYAGELFIDPSVKEQLFVNMLHSQRKATHTFARLTEREKEVLQLIIQEYGNMEIAEKLNISLRTVENHKYNLQQKLNAKNTVGLVKAALHMGILR